VTSKVGAAFQIVAGPGSGKTTELISRIASNLVEVQNVEGGIIACTFTRKATEELLQRLEKKVGPTAINSGKLLVGTIHSICLTLLRGTIPEEYIDWDVISEESQVPYVHSKLAAFGFSEPETRGQNSWDLARQMSQIFTTITDEGLNPESILAKIEQSQPSALAELDSDLVARILESYQLYLEGLRHDGLFDFATIQRTILDLLRQQSGFAQKIVENFPHIYVDEYQDVNDVQHDIFVGLCAAGARLTVVGDDDQSIYGFRGGKVEHLVNFEKTLQGMAIPTTVSKLETNYRSTRSIVSATSAFIGSQKYERLKKSLVANRGVDGPQVIAVQFDSDEIEAEWIAESIAELRRTGRISSFRSVGILFNSVKNHSQAVQHGLKSAGIPFQSSGSGGLLGEDFFKEFLALIKFWIEKDLVIAACCERLLEELDSGTRRHYIDSQYISKLCDFRQAKPYFGSSLALMYELFQTTDFIERHTEHSANLGTLTSLVHNFDVYSKRFDPYGLYSYLTFLRKQADIDYVDREDRDAVQVLTIHRSKGLEFDVVFVASQNERNKPGATLFNKFSTLAGRTDRDLDEKDRVLYVAMTRARNIIVLTSSQSIVGNKKTYSWTQSATKMIEHSDTTHHDVIPYMSADEFTDFSKVNAPQPTLSYNAIRLYEICPLQYRFSHVDRLETVRIGGMQFGTNMHRIVELLLRKKQLGETPDKGDISRLIQKYWRDLPTRPDSENVKFRAAGKEQLERFVEKFLSDVRPNEIIGVEEPFSLSIAETRITGRFDLRVVRHGGSEIVDFKTGDPDDYSSQLHFYAACLDVLYGKAPTMTTIYYLKTGSKVAITPDNLDNQIRRVEAVSRKILEGKFAATAGKHCSDCAYSAICEFSTIRKRRAKP
jgi:DNA helicase-2/ATP-dependent DNA helicase PcrA